MQRLIVKTAVKTALILLGIIIALFAIFCVAFPQHMATAMETLGNYDMAVKFANLRYVYTEDSFDLARCYDDSVLSVDDANIINYGEALMADENYDEVCSARNTLYNDMYSDQFGFNFDYDLRVRSTLAVSFYNEAVNMEGEDRQTYTQKAIDFAAKVNGNDRFAYGNSFMSLSIKIVNCDDSAAAQAMLSALEGVTPTLEEEISDLNYIKSKLRGVL